MEEEFMEIEMPKSYFKGKKDTGKEKKASIFKRAGGFLKKEAPIVRRAFKKTAITTFEYGAKGIEYLEESKLKELEEAQKTRTLKPWEIRKMESLKSKIGKLKGFEEKERGKLEKLKEVV